MPWLKMVVSCDCRALFPYGRNFPVWLAEFWLKLADKYCSGWIVVREKHCSSWKNKPNKPNLKQANVATIAASLERVKTQQCASIDPSLLAGLCRNRNNHEHAHDVTRMPRTLFPPLRRISSSRVSAHVRFSLFGEGSWPASATPTPPYMHAFAASAERSITQVTQGVTFRCQGRAHCSSRWLGHAPCTHHGIATQRGSFWWCNRASATTGARRCVCQSANILYNTFLCLNEWIYIYCMQLLLPTRK